MRTAICALLGSGILALAAKGAGAPESNVVDGVRTDGDLVPAVLSSSEIDFDTPELFSDTLPLQVFQSLASEAVFAGTGAVLDVSSFEVVGTSGRSALAFNGRTGVNGDGSVPQLPELVVFVRPDLSNISPKQTVSLDVGSKRDEGKFVVLVALDRSLNLVSFDFTQVAPVMETLTVTSATANIAAVLILGESDLKILVVDNLVYN